MEIYLPIAEVSMNIFVIIGLGFGVGILSGLFGVGGGFLLTPLLIIVGIPPSVAVASAANQVVGASVSGSFSHWRRGTIDFKMALILLVGGFAGSTLGIWIYGYLETLGQIDLVISLCYVLLLGIVGALMLIESAKAIARNRFKIIRPAARRGARHHWFHRLPFKMRFAKSHLYISILTPAGIGVIVGLLSAIMGVGGGFILVPAMIYLIGMPTSVVIGTSLFQISFVSANVTILQASLHQAVDVVLAVLLLVGGVIGAQLGGKFGAKLRAEELRLLLALMVLAMGMKIALELTVTPLDRFSVSF